MSLGIARNRTAKYRVFVNGQNLFANFDGQVKRVGFYTTRFLEARSPREAGDIAVDLIRQDSHLCGITLNQQDDPLMLFVDEIEEVNSLEAATGFAF